MGVFGSLTTGSFAVKCSAEDSCLAISMGTHATSGFRGAGVQRRLCDRRSCEARLRDEETLALSTVTLAGHGNEVAAVQMM